MSQDTPSSPSPDAPSTAVTNNEVVLALVAPPSPASPELPQCAGATNLFQDGTKKHHSDLSSTKYLPAKKKGGHRTSGAGISPRDAEAFVAEASDDNNNEDKDYLPTPTYKIVGPVWPKKQDVKVTLDSNYFAFLCPLAFDSKQFICGHLPVYSDDKIIQFNANFQRQLSFNFCAIRVTRKKSESMHEARASQLRDVDLDVTPISFLHDSTDCHKLSQYVLKDVLSCPVGCRIIVCIRSHAKGNPTEESHSSQVRHIVHWQKGHGLQTESWRMAGDAFFVIQGTISRSTLCNKIQSGNLSQSRFLHYFTNRSGDIGIKFEGYKSTLSVPWHNVINFLHIIMFFGKCFDQTCPWEPVFCFKTDPEYAHHVFCQFASEYFGDSRASAQLFAAYKDCMCSVYQEQCIAAESTNVTTRSMIPNFNFEDARIFQSSFDNICRHLFMSCFSDFNDYSMPILQMSDFISYLHALKRIFPQQWAFLSSHHNVNHKHDEEVLTKFKERQVLVSLLILQSQSNFCCLPHWCLILLTAMYGWGACDTLGHATSFLRATVSRRYREIDSIPL
jgi:hypothetical protein